MPEASPRLLRANELLLECVARGISPSTLVVAAFDAIYLCCIESTSECLGREEDVLHPDPEVLLSAKERLGVSSKEVTLALQLMQLSFYAFSHELCCLPADAVALARKV
ncbi:hypothetical protein CBA19CS22_16370 [Caballeronia novacaledonica]|uniref:Uncharacterized protein n=2 Tax=Caballeronia novacaledonica TaxID=1544861 RepID=A0AA37I9K6_9BURK|nr:hypothetical protein [Caballeronia novacaledonica]GJH18138.1 hypothetical protein CBA19CS22_16370 [Caballeronia novacaledonica]GJH25881.1 hypothetical protein CBA19CS42_15215 [Caballeronia novacaledonica]